MLAYVTCFDIVSRPLLYFLWGKVIDLGNRKKALRCPKLIEIKH